MRPSRRALVLLPMFSATWPVWRRMISRFADGSSGTCELPRRALLLLAMMAATWPVWRWMADRSVDGSGDTWELLAALTAAAVMLRDRHLQAAAVMPRDRDLRAAAPMQRNPNRQTPVTVMLMDRNLQPPAGVKPGTQHLWPPAASLLIPTLFLLAYAASYSFLSPLPRGMLAMAALGTTISTLWYGKRIDMPVCGLLLISLPVMASLNFYLGYPLRVVAGTVSEALLQMNGIAAFREGAQLTWNGQAIAIDAPCSGVKMLWTGAYLSFSLAAVMRLDGLRSVALVSLASVVVIAANALRATSLFYVEAGIVRGPARLHDAIGLVMFAFAAVTTFALARGLARARHA